MKKLILISSILVLCACTNKITINGHDFVYETSKICETKGYTGLLNGSMFLYCIDKIEMDGNEFFQYFTDTYQTFDDALNGITSGMKLKETYKDGGSKLYEKSGLRILVCNTLEGNKDIFIGNSQLTYKDNYCKNFNIDTVKEMINNTSKISVFTRESEFIKEIKQDDVKKIKEILLKSKEYNGPINLPYAGNMLVFYDKDNNAIGEFIYCEFYHYFIIDYHEMYVSNSNFEEFNKLVKLD